jgi:hypothetical protein
MELAKQIAHAILISSCKQFSVLAIFLNSSTAYSPATHFDYDTILSTASENTREIQLFFQTVSHE